MIHPVQLLPHEQVAIVKEAVPDMNERVAQLLAAPAGTTEYELFCPNK